MGTQSDYSSLILNQDFIFLSETRAETEIKTTAQSVVARIKNGKKVTKDNNKVNYLNVKMFQLTGP